MVSSRTCIGRFGLLCKHVCSAWQCMTHESSVFLPGKLPLVMAMLRLHSVVTLVMAMLRLHVV